MERYFLVSETCVGIPRACQACARHLMTRKCTDTGALAGSTSVLAGPALSPAVLAWGPALVCPSRTAGCRHVRGRGRTPSLLPSSLSPPLCPEASVVLPVGRQPSPSPRCGCVGSEIAGGCPASFCRNPSEPVWASADAGSAADQRCENHLRVGRAPFGGKGPSAVRETSGR